jgi:hypothetical protein
MSVAVDFVEMGEEVGMSALVDDPTRCRLKATTD